MPFDRLACEAGSSSEQTVLIVDDEFTSRTILAETVRGIHKGITIESFSSPLAATDWLASNQPDLILLDYLMRDMSGHDVLRHIRHIPRLEDVPVIVITAATDRNIRYQMLEDGATDFILKPIDHYECHVRCRNLLSLSAHQKIVQLKAKNLEQAVENATRKILEREHEALFRLARAGEFRDMETGNHILRMAKYSRLVSEALGLNREQCNLIELAAPMHDVGKIGIPDNILLKPSRLTKEEFDIMKRHTLIGHEILQDSPSKFLSLGAEIALGHHEKFDGSGYPYGRKGKDIPLEARIVAVADVYDALTSSRPYKKAWSSERAFEFLTVNKGSHFDPDCVDAFLQQQSKIMLIQRQLEDFHQPVEIRVAK